MTYRDLDDGAAGQVEATARIETTISAILGIDHLDVHVLAQTGLSGGSLEIVMVMDNSGSMSGNRISTLERAARDLVTNLFGQETIHPTITIGIVPFAATVNVGTGYRNASWMDRDGLSSIHFNNFDSSQKTRFELFDDLDNVTWGGCVEARPYPLDVNDTPASAAQPDTLFVPLFAPDAPDTDPGWGYDDYINDYISDTGGSCDSGSGSNGGKSGKKGKGNNGGGGNSEELTDRERQERICKYDGASASTQLSYGTRKGPNMLCDSPELTPLTNRKSDLISAIARLGAYGGTNIHAGIMWGWRVLSPGTPLTQARDYDEPRNQKIMIVMTDGTNFHGSYDNMNGSWYSAYGYEWEDRLGSGLNTTSKLVGAMNTRTLEACTNAKAAGISIYTIAFDVDDRDTRTMMKDWRQQPGDVLQVRFNQRPGRGLRKHFQEAGRVAAGKVSLPGDIRPAIAPPPCRPR